MGHKLTSIISKINIFILSKNHVWNIACVKLVWLFTLLSELQEVYDESVGLRDEIKSKAIFQSRKLEGKT